MKTFFFTALIVAVGTANGWCGSFNASGRGTSAARFLKLSADARAVGMGEAYVSAVDDGNALFWNPGALTRLGAGKSAGVMHAPHIETSYYEQGSFGLGFGQRGALGVGVQYMSHGAVKKTDAAGLEEGNFTPSDVAISAGYALKMKGVSLGVGVKFIQMSLLDSASTVGLDAGVLTEPVWGGKARWGAAVTNLAGKMKFDKESAPLPLAIRAGGSYGISDQWLVCADAVAVNDDAMRLAAGTEYTIFSSGGWTLKGRGGVNSKGFGVKGASGLSFGLGFGCGSLGLDYAFVPNSTEWYNHRISLSYRVKP